KRGITRSNSSTRGSVVGVLDRLRGVPRGTPNDVRPGPATVSAALFDGEESLEVVGEASYQSNLLRICRAVQGERVRHDVIAALVPEPSNPHDSNAVSVQVDRAVVGYLSRENAVRYAPGIRSLMTANGCHIALRAVIVGGGH